jgi:acylaminoacyl-peptidase
VSIRYVKDVTAPVLLCLGAKDRRVPFSQGMEYFHALKANRLRTCEGGEGSAEVVLRVYPECDHAIDKPNGEADQFICIKNFFVKYLKTSN